MAAAPPPPPSHARRLLSPPDTCRSRGSSPMCSKPNTSRSAMLELCSDSAHARLKERDDGWAGQSNNQSASEDPPPTRKRRGIGFRSPCGAQRLLLRLGIRPPRGSGWGSGCRLEHCGSSPVPRRCLPKPCWPRVNGGGAAWTQGWSLRASFRHQPGRTARQHRCRLMTLPPSALP